jgi:hypothetical protein
MPNDYLDRLERVGQGCRQAGYRLRGHLHRGLQWGA